MPIDGGGGAAQATEAPGATAHKLAEAGVRVVWTKKGVAGEVVDRSPGDVNAHFPSRQRWPGEWALLSLAGAWVSSLQG